MKPDLGIDGVNMTLDKTLDKTVITKSVLLNMPKATCERQLANERSYNGVIVFLITIYFRN